MTWNAVVARGVLTAAVASAATLAGCRWCPGPFPGCDFPRSCVEVCGGPVVWSGCGDCPDGAFYMSLCAVDSGTDAAAPADGGTDAALPPDGGADASGGSGDASASPDSGWGPGSLGAPCASAADCASGDCETLPFDDQTRCSATCDAVSNGCPEGGLCWVPGNFAGWCVRPCDPAAPDCPAGLGCGMTLAPDEYGCTP